MIKPLGNAGVLSGRGFLWPGFSLAGVLSGRPSTTDKSNADIEEMHKNQEGKYNV